MKYPQDHEALFWERYIDFTDLGKPLDLGALLDMVRADPPTLVAVMPLFGNSEGREHITEANVLLKRCLTHGTTRAQYVSSVLQGIMSRASYANRSRRDGETEN